MSKTKSSLGIAIMMRRHGRTTIDELFAAITGRDQSAVERILAADPNAATEVDANGMSALLTAVYHGNAGAVAALRATGMELTVFEAAARVRGGRGR